MEGGFLDFLSGKEQKKEDIDISPIKEELKKQLDKNVPLPGFEYASALAVIFGSTLILRRRY